MLHLGEHLFKLVCRAKYAHYLQSVGNKVRKSTRWKRGFYKNQGCSKQETWTSDLLNTEDQ